MAGDSEVSNIKVVLSVDFTRHVDIELDDFKKAPLQFVSTKETICHDFKGRTIALMRLKKKTKARNSHIVHFEFVQNLTVVDIPHSLVIPHLASEEDSTQENSLPIRYTEVNVSSVEQSL